jgi:[acyl-carrier-protein] S-malonyltransferase
MDIAILFPGQGAQYIGMGKDFYDNFEEIRTYYDQATEILGYDIKKIIFESDVNILAQTQYTQPSVFLTSFIIFEILRKKLPGITEKIKFVAGHSLGEYTAVCISGALNFEQTIKTVAERAKIMSEVSKNNPGGMLAVLGIEKDELVKICDELRQNRFIVEPVNFNTPQQIVVAGSEEGIKKLQEVLSKKKIKTVKLNVSGAFHSSLMNDAQKIFSQTLDKLNINNALIPIIMNYDAKPHTKKEEILENLKLQINHPVLWTDSVKYMFENGVNVLIECGPGKVLSNMLKKIVPDQNIKIYNVENIESLNSTLNELGCI